MGVFWAFENTYYLIHSKVHSIPMSAEEKQGAIVAWNKHVEGIARHHKFMSFSAVAEAAFCETFKRGVLAHETLAEEEKLEILAYMKQAHPVV